MNKPYGLNGSPGLRVGTWRVSRGAWWRVRGFKYRPHRAARLATHLYFPGRRRNQPPSESVPNSCQLIAELDVLAHLARRRNGKLRVFNTGRGTDSVPGHHTINNLQTLQSAFSFHFIPIGAGRFARDDVRTALLTLLALDSARHFKRFKRQPVRPSNAFLVTTPTRNRRLKIRHTVRFTHDPQR